MMTQLTQRSQTKVFEGLHAQYSHNSAALNCTMQFAIFLPPAASKETPVPVLYWLSGLTCTDENFMQKAGALKLAAELGIAIVAPDTSPRGDDIPDDPDQAYDFGKGAGFYLNATQAPWHEHYHMYDYVVDELPKIIEAEFPVTTSKSISGHSMGGHGSLTIALKNPQSYCSVSALAPIANPSNGLWGQKAFTNYLGSDRSAWHEYDATELIKERGYDKPILADVGTADSFETEELHSQTFLEAAEAAGVSIEFNFREGYDHGFYFVASFIENHLHFHAKHLFAT
ncbi:S-formylglutathione hydrolase [Umboniibacter marinipuniceus]|uniref:S-formylglutathione hydrolase n=1 Tax=Umboniibacter marinipuniceus TaxID=569599 RepID=A0A3M0AHM5_9GAMM|nr:S-formylglutathione hydrolase [Umboniibacter marinipuniceus]RMA78732.1 S-formylglutathione hydrolase [Umboniibacter marinipuniceus]